MTRGKKTRFSVEVHDRVIMDFAKGAVALTALKWRLNAAYPRSHRVMRDALRVSKSVERLRRSLDADLCDYPDHERLGYIFAEDFIREMDRPGYWRHVS
jgi:hypothetical protein